MALNDPQWGKRGNDGPPDLDELWRRLNQRLNSLFGGKGGGGAPSPGPTGRQFGGGFGLLVILILVVWLASGFYIVDASQRGVVLRFGKFDAITESGPRWHLPWPIESAEVVNVTGVRTIEIGYRNNVKSKVQNESLMITDDENIIDIQFAVQYILKDPKDYLFNNRDADKSVMQASESAIREVVGKNKMDFLLSGGKEKIVETVQILLQKILDRYKTGITVTRVTMQDAQAPEEVQAAFADAVKAGQDRERQINEGQSYFNDVVPKAKGTSARLLQEGEGYRQSVIANAEGEASRFSQIVTEYSKAPVVTRQRLYLDAMQQVLANSSKVVVDQKSGGNLLYLPLDKLMQMSSSANPPVDAGAKQAPMEAVVPTPAPTESSPRSRDAFRSRDREAR
ncbi:MAG: FtsH protease activity modulator HflK [Betaproteobacteria bacterium]|nr:FtsH protease activity modulator HflK [Betaproteobacteria bacterium]